MNPIFTPTALGAGLLAGLAVGTLYFLWLWQSLHGLATRQRAGLGFVLRLLSRLSFALLCLGAIARWGGLPALAAALAGFIGARVLLVRLLPGRRLGKPAGQTSRQAPPTP